MFFKHLPRGGLLLLILLTACNLPVTATPAPSAAPAGAPSAPPPTAPPPVSTPSPTPEPQPTGDYALSPSANPLMLVERVYDADSLGTADEGRAPYGERYDFNLFERPFDQQMTYLPALDIHAFNLTYDALWYYVIIELNSPYDESPATYAVEVDVDLDGFGDYLILVANPRSLEWSREGVQVFADRNHDVAGLSATKSDAPISGDGYETLLFDQGAGNDPGLAWARISPPNHAHINLAFRRDLVGDRFMYGVSADGNWQDPARYDYNDRQTEEQAGSPLINSPYYPLRDLYAYDNTCRQAFGFEASGLEARICPTEPPPTPTAGCVDPGQYSDQQSCEAAGCKWVLNGGNVTAAFWVCTYP